MYEKHICKVFFLRFIVKTLSIALSLKCHFNAKKGLSVYHLSSLNSFIHLLIGGKRDLFLQSCVLCEYYSKTKRKKKTIVASSNMLDGWYCRTMANQNAAQNNEPNVVDDSDDSQDIPVARLMPRVDYKAQYIQLKKKLKFLLYVSSLSFAWILFFGSCKTLMAFIQMFRLGKWIFPRCTSIQPTSFIESHKRSVVSTRSFAAIWKTIQYGIGKWRWHRIVWRWWQPCRKCSQVSWFFF